ncbi:sensor histidine kinase [Reichenbachiella versicolor]|uniref:sensor histidine kinase n=1 Tax=Reichenbachiella versicolor TaxID=1821036 RepID=UPI001FE8DFDC|nr:HAMP domain-containing sensor histidine kinase [Reichenbachiella versicolor]
MMLEVSNVQSKSDKSSAEIYRSRTRQKWVLLAVSVTISIVSIYFTEELVQTIREREKKSIALYAKTLEYIANQPDNGQLNFIFDDIIVANNSIPVIITDELGKPLHYRNIPSADRAKTQKQKDRLLLLELEKMEEEHEPLLITLKSGNDISGYQFIYYRNSFLLTQLKIYPIVQLAVIGIFAFISVMVFNYSKIAEQNRVWVGLAKETAHQLGTPLSSLLAWIEYLRGDSGLKNKEIVDDLKKDVDRLQMITERFSNIGSEPIMEQANLPEVIDEATDYLRKRISKKVEINVKSIPNRDIPANLNKALFEWVIENLCKNAVDAMSGAGKIDITIKQAREGHAIIDVADNGKGLSKSQASKIFQPGFTTKKRGWGLGLTLVKRIIENYHKGKIWVKYSEVNKGTTFRISLRT